MHRCQHSFLKKSFKSMSCSGRIHQFPRNFLCWEAPGCISMVCTFFIIHSKLIFHLKNLFFKITIDLTIRHSERKNYRKKFFEYSPKDAIIFAEKFSQI